jgi:hypothetical protein
VSEYDTQVRPQPPLLSYTTGCTDCWVKVDGAAALQPVQQAGQSTSKQRTEEGNCGDACVLYVVEQYIDANGARVSPRQIVGRTYRTGKVVSNVTDTVHVQTMT